MTEKQYKLEQWTSSSLYYSFPDGNLHHSIGEVIARVENDLNSLYNENEQLKQQNRQLKHWNKCLAEKKLQSYGYYTDSKAEKRVKDLFEHKPLNCSDKIKR